MGVVSVSALFKVLSCICMLSLAAFGEARPLDEMVVRLGTKRLASGAEANHVCYVRADGNVLCWGDNADGQIGDGTSGNVRRQPTSTGITTAVGVAVGGNHSCSLLSTGIVQCWGSNALGQLGIGSGTAASSVPITVPGITGVVSISAGTGFTCARKSDGTGRCWGTNQFGQLGDDTTTGPRFAPVQVTSLTDAITIVAGATHACVSRAGGAMACWGGNGQGQLGTGGTTNRDVPTAVTDVAEVTEIAAGLRFTCASRTDTTQGSTYCWGDNDLGQLGTGAASDRSTVPALQSRGGAAVQIVAGQNHACKITTSIRRLFCWGGNDAGQLGIGFTSSFEATPGVVVIGGDNWLPLEIAAGRRHTCALGSNDVVECWGDNTLGQLGNQGDTSSSLPTLVFGLSGSVSARSLAAGTSHSCAVRADGSGACWGRNDEGQIGDGTTSDRLVPTPINVSELFSFENFVSISAGGLHNCTQYDLGGFGQSACWGDNTERQAKHEAFGPVDDFVLTPESLNLIADRALSGGGSHSCGLAEYEVVCWGRNNEMQLGNSDVALEINRVGGLTNAIATAAAHRHTCALLANGRVVCWGGNNFGQLGDGTRNASATPRNTGLTTAVALSTTRDHSCALLADGRVACWGRNDYGQADGTLTGDRLVPTPVPAIGVGGAIAVTTGEEHTCILTPAGRVQCWGRNNVGQLGNNTQNNSLALVEVLRQSKVATALSNVVGLVADYEHTCALRTTGQPFCWGRNLAGELGDGTRTHRLTAVGVGSFSANIARTATLAASTRVAEVTALINCPEGERFTGIIVVTQASATATRHFSGACTGGLSEYAFPVPAQGRNAFAPGDAIAELEIVVHKQGDINDEQQWTRRIVLVPSAP